MFATFNEAALDELIPTIDELERLFAQAKDNPGSPAGMEMQRRLNDLQVTPVTGCFHDRTALIFRGGPLRSNLV